MSTSSQKKRKAEDEAHDAFADERENSLAVSTSNKRVARATAARYVYRDFSRVPPDEGETVLGAIVSSISNPSSIKHQKLPIKLDALLRDPELSQIIAWLPHGRAWRILKPKLFVKEVLTKYFDYCNYNSFVRLINAWGFRRLSSGPDRHAYFHELFLRGMPHLHSRMRRITGKDEKPPLDQDDEPDLYRISELYPVPPPQDSSKLNSPAGSSPQVASFSTTADAGSRAFSMPQYRDYSMASIPEAPASLLNLAEIADRRIVAPVDRKAAAATYSPFAAVAAQVQQASAQQQSLNQLRIGLSSVPISSVSVPSYAKATTSVPQQCQQTCDLALLSYMLQGAGRGSAVEQPRAPTVRNAAGEAPIMYIPVYPSTLARLGTGRAVLPDAMGDMVTPPSQSSSALLFRRL